MEEKQTNTYEEFKEYVDTETGECIKGLLLSEEEIEKIRQTQEGKRKAEKYYREKTEFESYVQRNFGSFYFNNYMELWKINKR